MRIEQLNENKIRIFLNLEDLKGKNIDLHTFMSNSVESQDLFFDMLNKAENELGFKTDNYKLLIETLASLEGGFIFTITRISPELNSNTFNLKNNVRNIKPNKKLSIFKFNNFDDFCEFCNCVNNLFYNYIDKFSETSLVLYKNNYYLIFNNLDLSSPDLKSFSSILLEFAFKMKNEDLLELKLKEYGKIIIPNNSILTCLKYFKNLKNS